MKKLIYEILIIIILWNLFCRIVKQLQKSYFDKFFYNQSIFSQYYYKNFVFWIQQIKNKYLISRIKYNKNELKNATKIWIHVLRKIFYILNVTNIRNTSIMFKNILKI